VRNTYGTPVMPWKQKQFAILLCLQLALWYNTNSSRKRGMAIDAKGKIPESWNCIDCGVNTAPGLLNRIETERAMNAAVVMKKFTGKEASVPQDLNTEYAEIYAVREDVWTASGAEAMGGCLCIGCLEKRIGRQLTPKDFVRRSGLNNYPGTQRLRQRRGY